MDATERDLAQAGIRIAGSDSDGIRLVDLRLEAPAGRLILDGASAAAAPGDRVALLGAPGRGKSTLFRGLAGLWPFGAGRIERPDRARMVFVPQRPYVPMGSLRAVVSYPDAEHDFEDARLREVLGVVGLAHLGERLDEVLAWDEQLSAHEQQLIAIARALLQQPDWLLLDEATSALDEPTERRICDVLLERLPRTGVIAAGLRPRALELMRRNWTLAERDGRPVLQAG